MAASPARKVEGERLLRQREREARQRAKREKRESRRDAKRTGQAER